MADIILINPSYFSPEESKKRLQQFEGFIRGGNMYFYPFEPPLGLASLTAYLNLKGYDCALIDMPGKKLTHKEIVGLVDESSPRLIGITAMTATMPQALELAEVCKASFPEIPVVLGGVHPTVAPEEGFSSPFVDFVIRGEGEKAIESLLEKGLKESLPEIPGLCFRESDRKIHISGRANSIQNLNELPMPDYSSFPAQAYVEYTQKLRSIKGISMLVSRGCPYSCSFCAVHQTMGRRWRCKSPERVSHEMDHVQNLLNVDGIWFKDSIFNLNPSWTKRFCQYRKASSMGGTFQINTRTDLIRHDELAMMAEAGLSQIDLGIESGSVQTLKVLRKGISLEGVRKAVCIAKRYVRVSGFFMIGVPGETEDDIDMTIRLAEDLELDAASISIFTPLPGTALYDSLASQGRVRGDEDKDHFTKALRSYCEVSTERLQERLLEFNEKFACR